MAVRILQRACTAGLALAVASRWRLLAGRAGRPVPRLLVSDCPPGRARRRTAGAGRWPPAARSTTMRSTRARRAAALIAALGDETKHIPSVDFATWSFAAPAGETIAAATLWRAGDTAGGGGAPATYQFWLSGPADGDTFDGCVFSLGCPGEGEHGRSLVGSESRPRTGSEPRDAASTRTFLVRQSQATNAPAASATPTATQTSSTSTPRTSCSNS